MTRKKHSLNDIFTQIIKEEINNVFYDTQILNEDKRTKQAMNRSRQIIRNHFNNESWLDTVFNHQDNPEGLTYLEYMFKQFVGDFYHNPQLRAAQTMRLMPLFCKLAFEFNFQNSNPDNTKLNRLRSILNYLFVLSQKGEDLSKISLDTTFDELNNVYGSAIDAEAQAEKKRMDNAEYVENKEYTVIGPVDFETAQRYGNESCPESKLCYTQEEVTWGNYTSDGLNNAYIILKDGWEDIPPQHAGENRSPYDEYGLSMIFVFVDSYGDLVFCNTRWNHKADYPYPFSCDHAMSKEMISDLIGRRFETVFKPNTAWQDKLAQIKERLRNGEELHNLFDSVDDFRNGFAKVHLNDKANLVNTNGELISDKWFDNVDDFRNGFTAVRLNNKWNFINTNGKLLSDQWFDYVDDFYEGFAAVELNDMWNLINTNGKLLFDQWFEYVDRFRNGFARVKLNNKWNLINTNGKLLFDQWFDHVDDFHEGFAQVRLNGKYNFINTNGKLTSDQWFDYVWRFRNGFARVELNDKYNLINTNGKLTSDQWFDNVDNFHEGFAQVKLNDKYNFINTNGELISDQWFDNVDNFRNGFAEVKLNDKYNFINTNGELISDQWFDYVDNFHKGFARVKLNNKWNLINTNGKLLSDQWFDNVDSFNYGIAEVRLNGKYNFINTNGKLTSDQWFDYIWEAIEGFTKVHLNDKANLVNTNGELISDQWFDNVDDFHEGFAAVKLNNKWNLINTNGKLLFDQWFNHVSRFRNGFARVRLNDKYNLINTNGKLLSDQWFDYVDSFRNGIAEVRLNGKYNFINTNGKLRYDQWFDNPLQENRKTKTIIISEKQVEQLKKVRQGLIAYENTEPDYEIGFEKPVDMSSYAHVINEKYKNVLKSILNEENRTQKRKCVEIITNNVPSMFQRYLDMPLNELPSYLQSGLNPDGALFKSVANNQNGCNKFIDYLRINLYQQFGIGRNSNLTYFIPGIARIACEDLGYYSFSPYEMKGGCIIKFSRLLKLFDKKEGFIDSSNVVFNEDFNGLSYDDMMTLFEPKIQEYIKNTNDDLDLEENKPINTSDYTIYPIPDMLDRNGAPHPTNEGRRLLNYFGRFTDWCVCNNANAEEEYAQYCSNGGKMYVCAKNGFEKINRPETTETPLDDYGLSLINVIVGHDGLPDNVTTRYNHDFGGENHSDLWEALHLQKVLNINYKDVFKPRETEELRAMHLSESKIIRENQNDKKANDYLKNVVGITDFEKIRKFIMDIYEAIPNSRLMRGRYLLGIVRLIHENGNKFKATKMNNILYNMKKQEFYMDRNLNDMTYDELVEKFYIPEEVQEVDGVKKIRQVANGYTIKHIETFDEMRMSCDGEWCISYADDIWYEIVEECHECVYLVENQEMVNSIDENSEEWYETSEIMSDPEDMSVLGTYGSGKAPYDTYGLSRFIVLIHPSYISVYSRWNIPNCLDGGFLNKQQLEDLLGLPFDEAFPYIKPVEYNEEDMLENRQIVNESAVDLEYHYTRLGNLLSMMRNDAIDLHQADIESNRNGANFLSLTRMRSNAEGYGLTVTDDSSIVIRIELNGQKLNNIRHVNIRPYDFTYNNWEEIMSDASDEEKMNRQTGREWGAWNAEAEDSLTLKDGGEQILDAIDLINRIDILLKPNIQNNHFENIKLWREFLNDINVYSDWGEKMHFYKTNNDFNYQKNELPLDMVYNFYDNNIIKESLEPEEVDLSSFEIKDKLNPKFWKDKKIDSRIRLKLLDIADDYVDSLNINWVEPEDITMTGSLANFTWNEEYSDIDLHIIIDYKKVDERTDFVRNYLDAKEKDWRNKHENLKIYGFPIEIYVQDKNEKHAASGVYSLEKNEWVLEPNKDNFNENDYEDEVVKNKVSEYTKKIDKLLEDFEEKTTESDIETIYNKSISLFNKIKEERNDELQSKDAKELSNGNLIFKSLRRNGYIEKLINLRNDSYDKCNSLN